MNSLFLSPCTHFCNCSKFISWFGLLQNVDEDFILELAYKIWKIKKWNWNVIQTIYFQIVRMLNPWCKRSSTVTKKICQVFSFVEKEWERLFSKGKFYHSQILVVVQNWSKKKSVQN